MYTTGGHPELQSSPSSLNPDVTPLAHGTEALSLALRRARSLQKANSQGVANIRLLYAVRFTMTDIPVTGPMKALTTCAGDAAMSKEVTAAGSVSTEADAKADARWASRWATPRGEREQAL